MRSLIVIASSLALVLATAPAAAQTPGDDGGAPDRVETPPLGVLPPLSQGLYTDLQVGTFFVINTMAEATGGAVSNAQPYIGIGVGYDITRNLVAGGGFAYGASSGICFEPGPMGCAGARSFSVILLNGYFGYLHQATHQWFVGGKALGGMALLTPEPVGASGSGMTLGFNGGAALTTEYHTHLENFVLGIDVAATFVMGGQSLQFPGLAIYPRLKYVF